MFNRYSHLGSRRNCRGPVPTSRRGDVPGQTQFEGNLIGNCSLLQIDEKVAPLARQRTSVVRPAASSLMCARRSPPPSERRRRRGEAGDIVAPWGKVLLNVTVETTSTRAKDGHG